VKIIKHREVTHTKGSQIPLNTKSEKVVTLSMEEELLMLRWARKEKQLRFKKSRQLRFKKSRLLFAS
jgi:hypothetical protein